MPYLFILFMCFLLTGCASTSVCPGNAEHQQFTQRSSQLTISRCKAGNLHHGPYTESMGQQVRLKGQYNAKGQRTGKWIRFASDGVPTHTFRYDANGKLHGEEVTYIKRKVVTRVSWVHDKKHGQMCLYHPNGAKKSCGQYVDDKPVGKWPVWDEQGKQVFTNAFKPDGSKTYWMYGQKFYQIVDRSNPSQMIETSYLFKTKQIIGATTFTRCPTGWCKHTSTSYWAKKDGNPRFYKSPQQVMSYESNGLFATNKLTQKRTRLVCNTRTLLPTITAKVHAVIKTCLKHITPTAQRHVISVKANEVNHILSVNHQYNTLGVGTAYDRCLRQRLTTIITPNAAQPKGICHVPMDLISTSPTTVTVVVNGNHMPSH